ncbi:MAG: proton-conducting transporter membrane subunit [Anaerolineae bacterium]
MAQTALIAGVLGLPVAVAIWLVLIEHGPPSRIRWAVSLTAGGTALCALSLLPFAGQDLTTPLTWLPTAGPMHLSLATTSLLAITATALAAVVVYVVGTPIAAGPNAPYGGALVLIALAAGNLAFLSGHFLLRYVALEIVGLCIAAAPLLKGSNRERFVHAGWVYLLLRFGDAGLLTAILLLGAETGTFEIGAALEAAATLPAPMRLWVSLGFFVAVAVKVGVWPFYAWIDSGRRLARSTYTWLYATLMPNLGFYLLYRVAALPLKTRPLYGALLAFGVGAGMLTLFTLTQRPSPVHLPARSTALLGTVIWCAALLGGGKLAWWGLLGLTVVRLPLYLGFPRREEPLADIQVTPRWGQWDRNFERFAERLRDEVETGVLDRGPDILAGGLAKTAKSLHATVEVGILERSLDAMASGLTATTEHLHTAVEKQSLEGLLRSIVRKVLQGSHQLQAWHTGRLRANLWWVVLCLVLAIGLVLAY